MKPSDLKEQKRRRGLAIRLTLYALIVLLFIICLLSLMFWQNAQYLAMLGLTPA